MLKRLGELELLGEDITVSFFFFTRREFDHARASSTPALAAARAACEV